MLPNGKVLVVGGAAARLKVLSSAETYDPVGEEWTAASALDAPHSGHSATLLPNGKVLIVGGSSAELYAPATVK